MKVRLIAAVGMAAATIVVAAPVARADGWAALAALATCTNDVDDPVVVTVTENVDQSVNLAVACHARASTSTVTRCRSTTSRSPPGPH